MSTYDRSQKQASYDIDEETDESLRELVTADYIVFLLALDVYQRWLKQAEASGMGSVDDDDLLMQGIALVRYIERLNLDTIAAELKANVSSQASLKLIESAMRFPPTRQGIAQRTLKLRIVFARNMQGITKAVFGNNRRALGMVRDALEAAAIEDPDQAMAKIAAIDMKHPRLEKWIDAASEKIVPLGTLPISPVDSATKASRTSADEVLRVRVEQTGASASSSQAADADERQQDLLRQVQAEATQSAEKALVKSGEENEPVTKAEAIGVATAAVVAAMNDPDDQRNVPSMLRGLDPEQLAAAMSTGRVLVAAGAGSGKTHTLTSRVAYLVQDQGVDPSKILVCCFNAKAARELKERISARVGGDKLDQMAVGTMHSIFRRFIIEYGTPEQKAALTTWMIGGGRRGDKEGGGLPSRGPSPGALGGYMSRVWKACKGEDPPRRATMLVQKWLMNDITPQQAAQMFPDKQEEAEWYQWWLGFKGVDKRWSPPCRDPKGMKQWNDFLSKYRDGGRARLGDFSDMILMFRDLLRDNPSVKQKLQGMFDHISVDEAQDLNEVQHSIVELLGEHIATDDPKRSLFAIGDESQSINGFAGARPDLFVGFQDKGFKLKNIATNYRCLPEIIELANHLMQEHPLGLPLMARPDPKKPRGKASIVFHEPGTHADAAIMTVTRIAQDVEAGQAVGNYAVLTRTNREINDFETACIIQGIPYARRGSSSFLQSPETVAVMSYVNLVTGQDYKKMQQALAKILNNPNRWLGQRGEEERIISSAVEMKARRLGVSTDQVNPLDLFDREGVDILMQAIDPYRRMQNWQQRAARDQIENLGRALIGIRSSLDTPSGDKPYSTQDLIGDILSMPGAPEGTRQVSLRDTLMPAGFSTEEEQDDDTEEEKEKPIGNVQFLFMLAQPTGKDDDPSNPRNFRARLEKLTEDSADLRIDLTTWDAAQQKLPPSERKNPPCATLSTIHSVKGAQWANVTVVMAPGVFPHKATDAGATVSEDEEDPVLREARLDFLTERQLAYVAFTRAGESLTVLSPHTNLNGMAGPTPRFIGEAGLQIGQNVPGKNDPTPSEEEGVRTVLAWDHSRYPEQEPLDYEPPPTYNRRGS